MTTTQIFAAVGRHGSPAVDRTRRALDLACSVHHGSFRLNGDPYITHPLAVAGILADLDADPDPIVAALLHDVVDDGDYPLQDVGAEFGDAVARILREFIELTGVKLDLGDAEKQIRMLGRFDRRVVAVKLADRLHNMQTISYIAEDKQYRKARETSQVIAPVVRVLGLGEIAVQLDALSAETLRRPRSSSSSGVAEPWSTETALRRARTLVHLAARLLMPRACREHWLAEWDGEINALTYKRERLRFVVDLALGLPKMAVVAHRCVLAENVRQDRT